MDSTLRNYCSKKKISLAVQRNLHKRMIREVFRQCRKTLAARDYVVLVRQQVKTENQIVFRQSLQKALEKN
ncbi:MAG: ribonuclease P protein component [Deltaproteobacteria bacterium]|nr:ribonuclease P protein component [Deltaproteobacteria bacterium]